MVAITEDDVRSLAAFKGEDAPVTSIYLDVDGGRHVRFQDVVRSADSLVKEALLNIRFSGDAPHVDGYVFTLRVTPGTKSQPASYLLNADPETETSGKNHF